jgi:hypothetical protein
MRGSRGAVVVDATFTADRSRFACELAHVFYRLSTFFFNASRRTPPNAFVFFACRGFELAVL